MQAHARTRCHLRLPTSHRLRQATSNTHIWREVTEAFFYPLGGGQTCDCAAPRARRSRGASQWEERRRSSASANYRPDTARALARARSRDRRRPAAAFVSSGTAGTRRSRPSGGTSHAPQGAALPPSLPSPPPPNLRRQVDCAAANARDPRRLRAAREPRNWGCGAGRRRAGSGRAAAHAHTHVNPRLAREPCYSAMGEPPPHRAQAARATAGTPKPLWRAAGPAPLFHVCAYFSGARECNKGGTLLCSNTNTQRALGHLRVSWGCLSHKWWCMWLPRSTRALELAGAQSGSADGRSRRRADKH